MGIETVLLTLRSTALAMIAIAPLIATRTSGQRRRSRHESVPHFHTTRLCVSWAKLQESGCNLATSRENRVFPPEKTSARVTNSGCKCAGSLPKPANPTVGLYLAVVRSRAFPPRVSSVAPHPHARHDLPAGPRCARGRTRIVTATGIAVSTRSARCAIDGRPARGQGELVMESSP